MNCRDPLNVLSTAVTVGDTQGMHIVSQEPLLGHGQPPSGDGLFAAATGVPFALYNALDDKGVASVQVLCAVPNVGVAAVMVAASQSIAARATDRSTARCPGGLAATGGAYATRTLALRRHHPHFRMLPFDLADRADGTYNEGPGGWEAWADNPGNVVQALRVYAFCW